MRLLIVSNRLPVTVKKEDDNISYEGSAGGLVTGLTDYLSQSNPLKGTSKRKRKRKDYLWVGWPGITIEEKYQEIVQEDLQKQYQSYPIFLKEKVMDKFYHGFCNKTLWPLFHYFTMNAIYDNDFWDSYCQINQMFCKALSKIIQEDDIVWVHDYHLMLLPQLLRENFPDLKIGFFLHIPFPAFEVFRLLPVKWRESILRGLLGADLVGFHTYEYVSYFLRSVQRILGYEHSMGKIIIEDRIIKADTFPMGIDFKKFNNAAKMPRVKKAIRELQPTINDFKAILSIDRLDYSKGIINRLRAFEIFLEKHPEYEQKVIFILIVVPSRTGIEHYQQIKKQLDESVGKINGKYSNINWTPILYQYKRFDFPFLAALYKLSDIALVTPLRDGMNLIAKEFVASKTDNKGVLILSEMAGAAKELGEAIIINPNNIDEITEALYTALTLDESEQIARNEAMRPRLRDYDVVHWADDFLISLQRICEEESKIKAKIMPQEVRKQLIADFKKAKKRLLLLDYDGTLTPLVKLPSLAKPSEELLDLLRKLVAEENTSVVLISGRDKKVLQKWFAIPELNFVAEHGVWLKEKNEEWRTIQPLTSTWKEQIAPLMQKYVLRVPGTFIEEKDFSLCWHYRNADQESAMARAKELMDEIMSFTLNTEVQVLPGSKVIEVKNIGINKGVAALHFLEKDKYDFVMAAGDDVTDEDLFKVLPENSYTIKIGAGQTYARYNLANSSQIMGLVKGLV